MSADIIGKLNTEIARVIADAKIKAHLLDLGVEPKSMSPAEFGKFIDADVENWAKVIKFAGIRPE